MSFLTYIYLGFYILALLSKKLADETHLDLFSVFTMSSVSVPWEALDLSNDPPLSDLLLMDLSFLLLDAYDLSVLLTVSILFFAMRWVMASSTTLGFVSMSLIPSLTIFSVVMTNGFWKTRSWCLIFSTPFARKAK